ncbi:MAG: outer membrane beta-barrel protein [Acidobacteria bacterium]|nr:outer membrane beta-barrel protein [Acidobacteriota bacterium]
MKKSAGLLALALVSALATSVPFAEDVKGKFYVGGNLAVLVTTDNIRSNAALIIAPLGRDGAPFTGDRGEVISCDATRSNVFCDPRPDDLLSRQTQLQQTLKFDGHIGYGLTSSFSVQLDTGYYKGGITNFDVFTTKVVPFTTNLSGDPCASHDANSLVPGFKFREACEFHNARTKTEKTPITAGQVTEIPVVLNGILRFRKDSNFNPYIGAGVGYLLTNVNQSDAVDALNTRLESLHVISVTDEFGGRFGKNLVAPDTDGNAPFNRQASVTIDRGLMWQFVGGGEYFFNDRVSLVFDARYGVSGQAINILMKGGQDQIDVTAFSEDLFRKDGSLKIFLAQNSPPNPVVDPNNPGFRYVCDFQTAPPPKDYNGDGKLDACFGGTGFRKPEEKIVVQGGQIRLSNFNFGFGIRFHF